MSMVSFQMMSRNQPLTCAEFRALRNAAAVEAMSTRLPLLNASICAICKDFEP